MKKSRGVRDRTEESSDHVPVRAHPDASWSRVGSWFVQGGSSSPRRHPTDTRLPSGAGSAREPRIRSGAHPSFDPPVAAKRFGREHPASRSSYRPGRAADVMQVTRRCFARHHAVLGMVAVDGFLQNFRAEAQTFRAIPSRPVGRPSRDECPLGRSGRHSHEPPSSSRDGPRGTSRVARAIAESCA